MSLTVLPTILFNNSTGSDSAASGAGPGTALSGSAANVTSASTTATITDAVDLSGVATDGSAVLWINTASGRQFSRISAISGSSGSWTLTLENSVWTTSTSKTWGIGGKRQTIGETNSRKLFSADALPGWTITLEDDQPAVISSVACTAAGDTTTGYITFKGSSTSTRRLLTSATNNISPLSGGLQYWRVENLKFTSTAATKTTSYGIDFNAANNGLALLKNCVFGDATNKLRSAFQRSASSQGGVNLIDCEVTTTLGVGVGAFAGTSGGGLVMLNCWVHGCGSGGVKPDFGNVFTPWIIDGCRVADNTGIGIEFTTTGQIAVIKNCTVHNNTSDGIKLAGANSIRSAVVVNNNVTKNGGYGINCATGTAAVNDSMVALVDYNNFGTGSLANTSGPVNGFTQGSHALTVDPLYTDATNGDFTPSSSSAVAGAAYPAGANLDIGSQQAAAGGGGGGSTYYSW